MRIPAPTRQSLGNRRTGLPDAGGGLFGARGPVKRAERIVAPLAVGFDSYRFSQNVRDAASTAP